MRPRNLTVVLAAVVGAALAAACGSGSEHPPPAQLSSDPPDATTASSGGPAFGDDAMVRDASPLCYEADASPPPGCACRYTYGNFLVIDIPCGYTFCSSGKMEAAECSVRGELTIVPNADIAHCPLADSDASVLPPCDAGTLPDAGTASDAAR